MMIIGTKNINNEDNKRTQISYLFPFEQNFIWREKYMLGVAKFIVDILVSLLLFLVRQSIAKVAPLPALRTSFGHQDIVFVVKFLNRQYVLFIRIIGRQFA